MEESDLSHLGELATVEVRLPESGAVYRLRKPVDVDLLLDLVMGDPEEMLPHWAEVWPSGTAMADAILAEPEIVRGQAVLELGCGLGTTAIAAVQSGADLTVTDYAQAALDLCRLNTRANAGSEPAALRINWRAPDDAFRALVSDGFPVVLGADVLYESRDIQPMVELAAQVVAPGGLFWLAEPGRPVAREFVKQLGLAGWSVSQRTSAGPWLDPEDAGIVVTVYQLLRPIADASLCVTGTDESRNV